jgi:type VI secretion system protein ImpH
MAMEAEGGRSADALADLLFDEPYRFGFFQAVRLLERMFPARTPVGYSGAPGDEVVRFRTRDSLEFPASQLQSIERGRDGAGSDGEADAQPEMFVNFMGLTGPLGVLPHHYTEELIKQRREHKNTAYLEFLDIFNHRLISLFYRAWEKYRFHIAYERGGGNGFRREYEFNGKDRFTEYLFDLLGMGTPHLRGRLGVEDEGLLFYGGLLAQRPHSASAIAAQVEQFTGQWLVLDEESLTRLGKANNELGVNALAGQRVWNSQSKFRIAFGPLRFHEYLMLLPFEPASDAIGRAFKVIGKMTRLMVGLEFDFDVRLRLRASEVPECVLATPGKIGSDADSAARPSSLPPMLGWTSWLKTVDYSGGEPSLVLPIKERKDAGAADRL